MAINITIKKDDKNRPIGWELSADTQEDMYKVNAIRNLQFFGFDDTAIEYNGRTKGDNGNAGTLHWIQRCHQKED